MSRQSIHDIEPGRRGISLSQLSDEEEMVVQLVSSPYVETLEIDQDDGTTDASDATHVPCVVLQAPDGTADMSGDPVEVGGEDPTEYNIINSSSAFLSGLQDIMGPDGSYVGQELVITAYQLGEKATSRTYDVDWA